MTEAERVWVIDDDQSIRWVLEKALGKVDVPVASFDTGNGALEALQKEEPAVIVSDIRMPGMNGLDGIERKLDPGPVFEGDLYKAEGLPQVPHSLPEAIAELERSEFARRSFGDEVIDHLLHFARTEQARFESAVTDFERERPFSAGSGSSSGGASGVGSGSSNQSNCIWYPSYPYMPMP